MYTYILVLETAARVGWTERHLCSQNADFIADGFVGDLVQDDSWL